MSDPYGPTRKLGRTMIYLLIVNVTYYVLWTFIFGTTENFWENYKWFLAFTGCYLIADIIWKRGRGGSHY
mgnify:CR=1 FL=1